jgi:transposase
MVPSSAMSVGNHILETNDAEMKGHPHHQFRMRPARAGLSKHAPEAKAMDYMLTRWHAFTRFLDDGRLCLTNNAAERALRSIALGRKAWLFCGSDRGGQRAAVMYGLITTAKLNDRDPQAWLANVLACIADLP